MPLRNQGSNNQKQKSKWNTFSRLFNKDKKKERNIFISSTETSTIDSISVDKESIKPKNTKPRTILLIGSTGKGKSTLANILVNKVNEDGKFEEFKEIFEESQASVSGTREVQRECFIENGINYITIDTVGIGDTKLKKEEVLDKLAEAVYLAKDGISQIFFVIGVKFDEKELANYDLLRSIIFDEKVTAYTTIIRTRFQEFDKIDKCQNDIDLMIANKDAELAKIVSSCQMRVIHVDNPSLNLVAADDEDEEEEKERIGKIIDRKETRSKSRRIVLKHLEQICQEEPYQPAKLKFLSSEISFFMEEKARKRKELAEKFQAERLFNQTEKVEESNHVSISIPGVEQTESQVSDELIELVVRIKDKNSGLPIKEEINLEQSAKFRVALLENELEDLNDIKELKESIQNAEQSIRQIILSHILNNFNDIVQTKGADNLISNLLDQDNQYSTSKLSLQEIQEQKDSLEAELAQKCHSDESLDQIQKYIEEKEQQLLESKKQLLDFKSVFEHWEKYGFSKEQVCSWADIFKNLFNPESDVDFCAWLRDKRKIKASGSLNYKELRDEYQQSEEEEREGDKKKEISQKWLDENYPQNDICKVEELDTNPFCDEYEGWNNNGKTREKIIRLNISSKELEGSLVIENFPNLEIIDCSDNKLTSLTLRNLPKLTKLFIYYNKQLVNLNFDQPENITFLDMDINGFPAQDLSFFNKFINIENLWLGDSKFCGSLEPLKDLNNLRLLDISDTDIESGLEYLPENLESIHCGINRKSDAKVKLLVEGSLLPYFQYILFYVEKGDNGGEKTEVYDYQVWRKDNLSLIREAKNTITFKEYIERRYPSFAERAKIKALNVSYNAIQLRLTGEVDFTGLGFFNLEKFLCRYNYLSSVSLDGLDENKFTELDMSMSQNLKQDFNIGCLSRFPNLKVVHVDNKWKGPDSGDEDRNWLINERITGSVESLRNLTKLEVLRFQRTNVGGDIGQLPSTIRDITFFYSKVNLNGNFSDGGFYDNESFLKYKNDLLISSRLKLDDNKDEKLVGSERDSFSGEHNGIIANHFIEIPFLQIENH